MRSITYTSFAREEILDALAQSRDPKEFLAAIQGLLLLIAEGVYLPPRIGKSRYCEAIMTKYPYSLILLIYESSIEVMAFAHNRRKPEYWKRRAGDSE